MSGWLEKLKGQRGVDENFTKKIVDYYLRLFLEMKWMLYVFENVQETYLEQIKMMEKLKKNPRMLLEMDSDKDRRLLLDLIFTLNNLEPELDKFYSSSLSEKKELLSALGNFTDRFASDGGLNV